MKKRLINNGTYARGLLCLRAVCNLLLKSLFLLRYTILNSNNRRWKSYIQRLEKEFSLIKNGFKQEEKQALEDYCKFNQEEIQKLAYLAYQSTVYQARMYAVFLFGYLSEDREVLDFMKKEVSKDENWRVQEVLAKSFDEYCRKIGYEQALPVIDEWLRDIHPNTRRAVTEGLRIWTSRPYFKEHPEEAIKRIAALKEDSSEYVRKSVGNALRDISKKYPEFIKAELDTWNIEKKSVKQIYQLASRFIEK